MRNEGIAAIALLLAAAGCGRIERIADVAVKDDIHVMFTCSTDYDVSTAVLMTVLSGKTVMAKGRTEIVGTPEELQERAKSLAVAARSNSTFEIVETDSGIKWTVIPIPMTEYERKRIETR